MVLGELLILAAGLRLYQLGGIPPGFFADEASIGYNAYTILTTATDEHGDFLPLFFRAFGEFKSPIQTYSTVPFIALFGLSETATRIPAALYGVLAIPVLYLLARHYLPGARWGLLAGLLLALSPWHIPMSRVALEGLMAYVLAFTVAVFLLERARQRIRLLPWFALACGLGLYTYFPARLTLPLLFGLGTLLILPWWRRSWRHVGLSIALFAILLTPLAYHVLLGEGSARWAQVGIWQPGEPFPLKTLVGNYVGHFTPEFLWVRGDGFGRNYIEGFGLMYRAEAPFFLLGILYAVWRRLWVVLLWLFLLYPLPGTITADGASNTRDIAGATLFPLLTTLGVYTLIPLGHRLASAWRSTPNRLVERVLPVAAPGAVAIAILVSGVLFVREYFGPYPGREYTVGFYGWQYGPREIVGSFLEHQQEYDQFIMEPAFNAPEIFLKFYAPDGCPGCRVGWPSREFYRPGLRQLFAAREETLKREGAQYTVKDRILYPNGQVAFLMVEIEGFKGR